MPEATYAGSLLLDLGSDYLVVVFVCGIPQHKKRVFNKQTLRGRSTNKRAVDLVFIRMSYRLIVIIKEGEGTIVERTRGEIISRKPHQL